MAIAATASGIELAQDWDKTFPESDKMVLHGEKAHSRYFGEDAFKCPEY